MTERTKELRRIAIEANTAARKASDDRRAGLIGWPEYDIAWAARAKAAREYHEALAAEPDSAFEE